MSTTTCDHAEYNDYFEKCTDCNADKETILAEAGLKECEDCMEHHDPKDGRPYKYEPSIWLCDACHDDRMEDE